MSPAHKKSQLQGVLTEFAIEIGIPKLPNGKCDKVRYNKAWLRLWKRIATLDLFPKSA